mmetsp:Transcript_258/g.736  ORF Transcript_258/g.736 Transcript_258/m.736 type:complete len:226 (+) Transcript_258:418-1095(+)
MDCVPRRHEGALRDLEAVRVHLLGSRHDAAAGADVGHGVQEEVRGWHVQPEGYQLPSGRLDQWRHSDPRPDPARVRHRLLRPDAFPLSDGVPGDDSGNPALVRQVGGPAVAIPRGDLPPGPPRHPRHPHDAGLPRRLRDALPLGPGRAAHSDLLQLAGLPCVRRGQWAKLAHPCLGATLRHPARHLPPEPSLLDPLAHLLPFRARFRLRQVSAGVLEPRRGGGRA